MSFLLTHPDSGLRDRRPLGIRVHSQRLFEGITIRAAWEGPALLMLNRFFMLLAKGICFWRGPAR
jgi:hypothetical protein